MDTWNNSTLHRRVAFENSTGNTGIRSIEARITQRGNCDIRIERAPQTNVASWYDIMPRIDAKLRRMIGSDVNGYYASTSRFRAVDSYGFEGNYFVMRDVPLESLDAALATVVGSLSQHVDTRDAVGITKPLLDTVAATKALRELGLNGFVEKLRVGGYSTPARLR